MNLNFYSLTCSVFCFGLFLNEQYVFSGAVGTPASSAERVCLVVHKVDFVWHSVTGRMLCRELHFKMPAQLSCRFDLAGLCVCVRMCVLRFSRPVSCIFAMSLKQESINLTIPAMGVTSMFECLFLCWPGYTEHPLSLSRKTSCPVRVIQWKYATVSSTALFARLQIITSPLAGGFLSFGWGNRQLHSDISDDTKKFSVTETQRWRVDWTDVTPKQLFKVLNSDGCGQLQSVHFYSLSKMVHW